MKMKRRKSGYLRQGVQPPGTLAAIRELDGWARTYTESRLQAASAS